MTAAITLNKLAKSYAEGEIDKEKYRTARAELLDAVILGKAAVEELDFPPPVIPADPGEDITKENADLEQAAAITQMGYAASADADTFDDEDSDSDYGDLYTEQPEISSENQRLPYRLIGGIALAVIAVVILYVYTGGEEQADRPANDEQTTITADPKIQATKPAVEEQTADATPTDDGDALPASRITAAASQLIDNFLAEKNWSEQQLDAFVLQWRSLEEEDRTSVIGSGEYSQLVNAVYKRLLEEQAMSVIDAEAASAKQKILVDFAGQIGINDNRIRPN